jgi:hypothetical protein
MSDLFDDPFAPKKRNIFSHAGFRFGFIGAVIAVSVNLALILINSGDTRGDWFAWLIQIVIYFFISRNAAESQYNDNLRSGSFEHLRGVKAAGLGAGLTTSALVWTYIIIRGIARDAMGILIIIEPFSFCLMIIVDVLVAMGLGAWGGNAVAKKYGVDRYESY